MDKQDFYDIITSEMFFTLVEIVIYLLLYSFICYVFEKEISWGLIVGYILGIVVVKIGKKIYGRR